MSLNQHMYIISNHNKSSFSYSAPSPSACIKRCDRYSIYLTRWLSSYQNVFEMSQIRIHAIFYVHINYSSLQSRLLASCLYQVANFTNLTHFITNFNESCCTVKNITSIACIFPSFLSQSGKITTFILY